jgi:hypothetical protein
LRTLSEERIAKLIEPYVGPDAPEGLYGQLSAYLDLLMKWNARTNLTSIRQPEEIVRRHFGESLFAGIQLKPRVEEGATLLDFGSGAGFPGIPIQLLLPTVRVTLAESQGKKAYRTGTSACCTAFQPMFHVEHYLIMFHVEHTLAPSARLGSSAMSKDRSAQSAPLAEPYDPQ